MGKEYLVVHPGRDAVLRVDGGVEDHGARIGVDCIYQRCREIEHVNSDEGRS